MRFFQCVDRTEKAVFVNPATIAYLQDAGTYREIHFVGAKDNYIQTKETLTQLALGLTQMD